MSLSIKLSEEQIAQLQVGEDVARAGEEIKDSQGAARLFRHMGKLKREHFVMVTLNAAHKVIDRHNISVGTLTASLVHPREVFAEAIADRAASIIVAHNHPSGNLEPSDADRSITDRLREAGDLLGISVLDHFIITDGGHRCV